MERKAQSITIAIFIPITPNPKYFAIIQLPANRNTHIESVDIVITNFTSPMVRNMFAKVKLGT